MYPIYDIKIFMKLLKSNLNILYILNIEAIFFYMVDTNIIYVKYKCLATIYIH